MTAEQETLEKIKFVLLCNNDAQAIRHIENYGFWKDEQKEDLAIGFAEWLMDNCTLSEDRSLYSYNSEDYTNARLLEIYKKEKGL